MEVDENLLGHVLGLVRIGQHPVGYAGHTRVFTFEQRLERLFARFHEPIRDFSEMYTHYKPSPTTVAFVTPTRASAGTS